MSEGLVVLADEISIGMRYRVTIFELIIQG